MSEKKSAIKKTSRSKKVITIRSSDNKHNAGSISLGGKAAPKANPLVEHIESHRTEASKKWWTSPAYDGTLVDYFKHSDGTYDLLRLVYSNTPLQSMPYGLPSGSSAPSSLLNAGSIINDFRKKVDAQREAIEQLHAYEGNRIEKSFKSALGDKMLEAYRAFDLREFVLNLSDKEYQKFASAKLVLDIESEKNNKLKEEALNRCDLALKDFITNFKEKYPKKFYQTRLAYSGKVCLECGYKDYRSGKCPSH